MMRWHMKAPGARTEGILLSKVFLRAVLLEMLPWILFCFFINLDEGFLSWS